jgi:phosphatidylinositol phospholipase C delta
MKITVSIISACNLVWEDEKRRQEEVVDPYIKVRIAGHKED